MTNLKLYFPEGPWQSLFDKVGEYFKSLHEYCEQLTSEEKLHMWQSFNAKTKVALKKYRQHSDQA
jgi:hypothetical protein